MTLSRSWERAETTTTGRLDQLLNTMRRTEFPPVLLKAVLTPTNRTWDSRQLWQELRREHEAMRGGQETQ